jgi:hypothetical protein
MQVASEAFQEQRVRLIADRPPQRKCASREFKANRGEQDRDVANAQLRDKTALDPAHLRR